MFHVEQENSATGRGRAASGHFVIGQDHRLHENSSGRCQHFLCRDGADAKSACRNPAMPDLVVHHGLKLRDARCSQENVFHFERELSSDVPERQSCCICTQSGCRNLQSHRIFLEKKEGDHPVSEGKGGSEKRRAKTLSCPNGQTQQALRLTPQSCCLTAQFGVCYTAMNDNESVRKYLSEIGTKGGRSGKGTKWRKAVCRHAAVIRWRKYREKQRIDELAARRMEEKTNEQLAVDQRDRDAVDRAYELATSGETLPDI